MPIVDIIDSNEWGLIFKAKDNGYQIIFAFETVRRLKSKFCDIKNDEIFKEDFSSSLTKVEFHGDKAKLQFESGGTILFICDAFSCKGLYPDIVYFDVGSKFYPDEYAALLSIEKNKDWH